MNKVVTGEVRIGINNLIKPKVFRYGEEPQYTVCVIIPKENNEDIVKVREVVMKSLDEAKELYGEDAKTSPIKNGDKHHRKIKDFEGCFYMYANSKLPPGVVDKDMKEIVDEHVIYPGCYGRVSMEFYPYKYGDDVGVGCAILNVMKTRDGEYINVRSTALQDFGDIANE